ncbi:transmembrane emp24 domain-containing protein 10 [Planoprotostelium fungivorum]|uniref:Transmembrane emp24 domain-containing protein 10 n=1 Tax=Planoprotostelium fungivorum TaxID=1890364 RepID=A0A2P6N355_9EUKA|nr:transmembrane emp24 domain-containing protein 10 [Planoprotostelium fungivorum]
MNRLSLVAVLLVVCLSHVAAISFNVRPNTEKCLREEFKPKTKVKGTVEISPPHSGDLKLTFRILGANNAIVYQNLDVQGEGGFSFFAPDHDIEYAFCFTDSAREGRYHQESQRQIRLRIDSDEKRRDLAELAKKDHLKPIEVDMLRIEDDVTALMREFIYMKDLESHHRDTSESTNSRVKYATILSSFILISLGVGQLFYLKRFFKTKKLI